MFLLLIKISPLTLSFIKPVKGKRKWRPNGFMGNRHKASQQYKMIVTYIEIKK